MSLTRNQAIKSFSAYLDENFKYDLVSFIKYCNLNYINNWNTWLDWKGFGFSFQNKKLKKIQLPIYDRPVDIEFKAHPRNYVDQCDSICFVQTKNRSRFWFWKSERFFRYAEFSAGWELKTPCESGVISASRVLSKFLDRSKKCDGMLVDQFSQLSSPVQELFNLD